MNWVQYHKDPVSHICVFDGAVVACWPLTQEVADVLQVRALSLKYFCH